MVILFQSQATGSSDSSHFTSKSTLRPVSGKETKVREKGIPWTSIGISLNRPWHRMGWPFATLTENGFVGMTGSQSRLATFLLIKLCVDPLAMSMITCYYRIMVATLMVRAVAQPVRACKDISGSWGSASYSSSACPPSSKRSWGFQHQWPTVKRSLKLKHSPWVRRRCTSSQKRHLRAAVEETKARRAWSGKVKGVCTGWVRPD